LGRNLGQNINIGEFDKSQHRLLTKLLNIDETTVPDLNNEKTENIISKFLEKYNKTASNKKI